MADQFANPGNAFNDDEPVTGDMAPAVPVWLEVLSPAEEFRAAFEAWLHTPTRAVLVRLWMPDSRCANEGHWLWRIRHRGAIADVASVSSRRTGPDVDRERVRVLAEVLITDLEKRLEGSR